MPNAGPGSRSLTPPMRRIRTGLFAVALILLGAGCARPQVAGAAELDALAAKGDTAALAKTAERECVGKTSEAEQTCYEDYFVKLARSDRVAVALGSLAALAANHPQVQREGHGYTHVIGIRAWKDGADVAAIFRSCNGLFQSGCYHGVIQAYLTEGGANVDSARAVQLRPYGSGSDSRHRRDLVVLISLNVVQHERRSRTRRQCGDCAFEVNPVARIAPTEAGDRQFVEVV